MQPNSRNTLAKLAGRLPRAHADMRVLDAVKFLLLRVYKCENADGDHEITEESEYGH